jgi:hypothetical protein
MSMPEFKELTFNSVGAGVSTVTLFSLYPGATHLLNHHTMLPANSGAGLGHASIWKQI